MGTELNVFDFGASFSQIGTAITSIMHWVRDTASIVTKVRDAVRLQQQDPGWRLLVREVVLDIWTRPKSDHPSDSVRCFGSLQLFRLHAASPELSHEFLEQSISKSLRTAAIKCAELGDGWSDPNTEVLCAIFDATFFHSFLTRVELEVARLRRPFNNARLLLNIARGLDESRGRIATQADMIVESTGISPDTLHDQFVVALRPQMSNTKLSNLGLHEDEMRSCAEQTLHLAKRLRDQAVPKEIRSYLVVAKATDLVLSAVEDALVPSRPKAA